MRSLWGSGASRPGEQWHLMGRATAKWYSTVQGVTVSTEAGCLLHRVDANPSWVMKDSEGRELQSTLYGKK